MIAEISSRMPRSNAGLPDRRSSVDQPGRSVIRNSCFHSMFDSFGRPRPHPAGPTDSEAVLRATRLIAEILAIRVAGPGLRKPARRRGSLWAIIAAITRNLISNTPCPAHQRGGGQPGRGHGARGRVSCVSFSASLSAPAVDRSRGAGNSLTEIPKYIRSAASAGTAERPGD